MSSRRPTLFVTGFPSDIRARDLAYEFEKYGEIIRCDVPAPPPGKTARFAFVEYIKEEDAAKAHAKLHGENFEGQRLIVEWAKRNPGSRWRAGTGPQERDSRDRDYDRDRDRRDRDYDRDRDFDRDRDRRRSERDRSRSPRRDRDSGRDRERRRSRTPPSRSIKERQSPRRDRDD